MTTRRTTVPCAVARCRVYTPAGRPRKSTVRLEAPDDKWHAELYVRNVSNSHAKLSGNSVFGGFMEANFVQPRMFGVRVGASY